MEKHEFIEVETPTLTRSTPEGARDFVVPARIRPGSWYALPQSPQLFKQMLMVGGMERYYQLARCYRDEDSRADRQPEFTQLDLEMSFVDQDDVIAVTEDILKEVWAVIGVDLPLPLPRMPFKEAMDRFGSDKPDLRFGYELVELTEYFKDTPFRVFQNPYVGAVVMPGGASQPRRTFDAWQDWAKARGAKGLAYVTIDENGEMGGPVSKNISDTERAGLAAATGAKPGDCIFFAAGQRAASQTLLGAARIEIGKRCGLIDPKAWAFTWVVDAPLFNPPGKLWRKVTWLWGIPPGPRCITPSLPPSPNAWITSTPTRVRPWPMPTILCATAWNWEVVPSVSTVAISKNASSR